MTLDIRPAQARLLAAIRRAGAPRFVVVGAIALRHHVRLQRETHDVDLAVVASHDEIASVLSGYGWKRDARHVDRWMHGDERIDVVPATPTLIVAGAVRIGSGERELSLVGFDLALEHTVLVSVLDVEVEVATLPVIVILKMLAWLDRPHERLKDLGDLALVLDQALDDFDERRWVSPLVDVAVDDQSAFFMGQSVREIVRANHLAAVEQFLEQIAKGSWPAVFAVEGRYSAEDPEAMAKRRLDAFRKGLTY